MLETKGKKPQIHHRICWKLETHGVLAAKSDKKPVWFAKGGEKVSGECIHVTKYTYEGRLWSHYWNFILHRKAVLWMLLLFLEPYLLSWQFSIFIETMVSRKFHWQNFINSYEKINLNSCWLSVPEKHAILPKNATFSK